jgi:benzoate-CoA ligase family protein
MIDAASEFNLHEYFLSPERIAVIGDHIAIEHAGERLTYRELKDVTSICRQRLYQSGIEEGDRVVLLLYDSPLFIAYFLATVSIGAICAPVNTALPKDDVEFIISDCGAKLVVYEAELKAKLSGEGEAPDEVRQFIEVSPEDRRCSGVPQIAKEANPASAGDANARTVNAQTANARTMNAKTSKESPAFMLYTSGSTGRPKGALHSHGAIPYTVKTYAENTLGLTEKDRVYSSSRLFFAYGLGNSFSFPLAAGATSLLDAERPAAERIAMIFEEQKPTVFFGVPAIYRLLLDLHLSGRRLDVSTIRLFISAGEGLPARIFEDWRREFGHAILDGIGSTEMLHIFISNRPGDSRAGSSGKVVEGYEARLLDDNREAAAEGELGNLWVRGGSSTLGYWRLPELTQATIQEGWVRTGDIYRRDREGFFYHVGRSDDCFKVKGLWVSPVEVESALLEHEDVLEAAAVSAIDADGLATVRAFVVIRKEGDGERLKEELRNFAGSRLPKYKAPSLIEIVDEMPRTSTGKIQRFKLRAERPGNLRGGTDDRQK